MNAIPPNLLTPQEVADRLNVTLPVLGTWRHRKKGPNWIKLGSIIRYPEDDLNAWFLSQNPTKKPAPRCTEERTHEKQL